MAVVVNTNFDFLKLDIETSDLFMTINMAEQNYAQEDYEGSLIKVRKIAEYIVFQIADKNNIIIDKFDGFNDVLNYIKPSIKDKNLIDSFYYIKGKGNSSAHQINSKDATKENSYKSLKNIFYILVWYVKTYIDPKIEDGLYDKFLEPKSQDMYSTAERKFIYIQTVNNDNGMFNAYDNSQKIGEGTISNADLEADWSPNSEFLRNEAPKRINQYMRTSGLPYLLGWVELAYKKSNKTWFHDYDVHNVLRRSGYKKSENLVGNEWYQVDLEIAKEAIKAVKNNQEYINKLTEDSITKDEIKFRPEQKEAINQTQKVFKKKNQMLWNAKMRFGKTLTALELIKKEGYNKVLIITHRPVVSDSWFEDFKKLRMNESGYEYGSNDRGSSIAKLKNRDLPFIYFASIQLLRYNNGLTNLSDYSDVEWDLIIIDEAHEGTQTELSEDVLKNLIKENTKTLGLSGTPFNILDKFEEEQVYTWDYTMEQTAKLKWSLENPDKPNPYEGLPKVSMFTFEMKHKELFSDESKSFNFREFFKVDENNKLVYKKEVEAFLDNITKDDKKNHYPFSTQKFRNELRHTLWIMPGIKEANAFEDLLKEHSVFGKEYKVVNVVRGSSFENEIATEDDLKKVRRAIGEDPSNTKTITLTVRKLTTGVNIPEWTAVLFLSNTNSAMNYLQAAFRAQTPFSHEKLGRKTNCYIFDFAPDRALTVLAESAQINSGVGKKNTEFQKQEMTNLLNFLPILGSSKNGMKTYDVNKMLTQLKKVYAEKAVRSGFEDDSIYNDQLLTLTEKDADIFNQLNAIVGKSQKQKVTNTVVVNENGLSDEEYEIAEKSKKKPSRERTQEELEALEKVKEAKKQRKTMISILRGVSIRIPMMIYGMKVDISEDISIEDFVRTVDEESWKEFMPSGFTKGMFKEISKYYDAEVFIEAGRIIRHRAKSYDRLDYFDRAEKIAELFSTFKNPDKETVLTPWRVVNIQSSKSIGGLNFYDDKFLSTTDGEKNNMHWVETEITKEIYQQNCKFIDINSKTGLYPLHSALSLYYKCIDENDDRYFNADEIYKSILEKNIYAIAKTPMAKTITERTLRGYNNYKTNVQYIENFTDILKEGIQKGKERIEEVFNKVKFDVVIGNPPYQEESIGDSTQSPPIYHKFMDLAYSISNKVILITPARFLFNAGATGTEWNKKMLNDEHLKVLYFEQNSNLVFPNTDIKGGVVVTYRDSNKNFGKIGIFTSFEELTSILNKVNTSGEQGLNSIMYGQNAYRFTKEAHKENPTMVERLSKGHSFDLTTSIFEKLPDIMLDEKPKGTKIDYIRIYGRQNNERIYKWVKSIYIEKHEALNSFKVILPKSNGSGSIGEVLSTPLIGEPLIGHTQTFISLGKFDTFDEALAALKYIKTKFARTLLGVLKITQDNPPEKWKYVPLQNFTQDSDIDWSKSISEIDRQLYKKYNLSEDEINFIEEKIKSME